VGPSRARASKPKIDGMASSPPISGVGTTASSMAALVGNGALRSYGTVTSKARQRGSAARTGRSAPVNERRTGRRSSVYSAGRDPRGRTLCFTLCNRPTWRDSHCCRSAPASIRRNTMPNRAAYLHVYPSADCRERNRIIHCDQVIALMSPAARETIACGWLGQYH
jgi:hypothetical protein